ncbi:hypothetical protein AVEN_220337-1 [Araneus ventricosus]|uniref:CCHC-type domain-containing protein n=1 Tax=Araneus ventricosus TaxID=182803 RepID=A0A4Y2U637_ARAVE|nr:hypothetical protein AVEN_220337-1 [Araneus ventricosus]
MEVLRSVCFLLLMESKIPHVLALRGDPLDGWCSWSSISIRLVSQPLCSLLGIRKGHSGAWRYGWSTFLEVALSDRSWLASAPFIPQHFESVITCGSLLNFTNEEITQELTGQGVKDVRRINIRRDGELLPTKHFILTFNTPRLPEYIKAGYVLCSVRPYIPNPLRCFKCQRFGHSKINCRWTLICARCAVAGHESTGCTAVEKCVNCQGNHTSFSRSCPKWELEKEIVTTKFKNNISFPEARRLVKALTPIEGKSYASVVDKNHPIYQTAHCPHCRENGGEQVVVRCVSSDGGSWF